MATAAFSNLYGISPLPKPLKFKKNPNNITSKSLIFSTKCSQISTTSRRASIGLAAIATLFNQLLPLHAEEENNGLWLTGPLPVPTVTNSKQKFCYLTNISFTVTQKKSFVSEIANEETGTRSFLKKGIYMANIGVHGSTFRLKHYAFDLLALGDLFGQDAWNYMRKYLSMKATVMYYDFDKVISAAPDDQKQPLLQLANRLFDTVEKVRAR